MLGMAVGTGNIWRFPRIAASNGGGSFLVAWVVFLLAWSVPLLILEFGVGKATRRGAIGSFVKILGPGFAWMGAWIAFVATAIMFYYSVVMGWTIRFFVGTITGDVPTPGAPPDAFWEPFHSTPGAILTHAVAMGLALFVVSRGVRGIETAAKVLIPSLIVLVLAGAIAYRLLEDRLFKFALVPEVSFEESARAAPPRQRMSCCTGRHGQAGRQAGRPRLPVNCRSPPPPGLLPPYLL